jgi:hypothetical protein
VQAVPRPPASGVAGQEAPALRSGFRSVHKRRALPLPPLGPPPTQVKYARGVNIVDELMMCWEENALWCAGLKLGVTKSKPGDSKK